MAEVATTVRFVNDSPTEVHNEAFGPVKWINSFQQKTDLLPMGPGSPNQVGPALVYGTEPPGGYKYDGKNHGNGSLATPLTDDSRFIPLPRSRSVTFTAPGKFHYFCLIHGPDMSGDVIVQP